MFEIRTEFFKKSCRNSDRNSKRSSKSACFNENSEDVFSADRGNINFTCRQKLMTAEFFNNYDIVKDKPYAPNMNFMRAWENPRPLIFWILWLTFDKIDLNMTFFSVTFFIKAISAHTSIPKENKNSYISRIPNSKFRIFINIYLNLINQI